MLRAAFYLMVLWSYLLVVCFYAFTHVDNIGTTMTNSGAWLTMLASAIIVPLAALAIISSVNTDTPNNKQIIEFISLNKKQLRMYGFGVLLAIILVGGLIMLAAAIWGCLLNIFLCIYAWSKSNA